MSTGDVRQRRRAIQLEDAETSIMVRRVSYDGEEHEELEEVRVPIFGPNVVPARLRVHGSATRNLGDFNSARVEVMLDMPCLPELSEVDRVYAMASAWVEERIAQELDNVIQEQRNEQQGAQPNQGQGRNSGIRRRGQSR